VIQDRLTHEVVVRLLNNRGDRCVVDSRESGFELCWVGPSLGSFHNVGFVGVVRVHPEISVRSLPDVEHGALDSRKTQLAFHPLEGFMW
jgi:hypothetical protein